MDTVDASNLLRTRLGASEAEVEAAYRNRRAEVRKRFETAPDRNTRTRCEREYSSLEQARDLLLADTDDLLSGNEKPAIEPGAISVGREAPRVEGKALPVEPKAPTLESEKSAHEREAPVPVESRTLPVESQVPPAKCEETAIEREALPIELKTSTPQREETVVEHESLLIKRVSPPIEPVRSPIKRTFGPIERALSALEPVVGPIATTPSSMKRVAAPGEAVSPPGKRVSPVKELERTPVETGLTGSRTRSTPMGWQAITGVTFTLVSASALGFFLLRAPDKPKQGKIIVNTVPDGADVWLDGAPRGQTPLILENVTPGDRRLTIKLPGYLNEELAVSVKPGEERSTRIVQLVPSFDPLLSK